MSGLRFQAGGTLPREGTVYVERNADKELPAALARGEYCHVLAPRQIGKSSLQVHAEARLRAAGGECVRIDLTTIGVDDISVDQFYYSLIREISFQLGLEKPDAFWRESSLVSPVHRWMIYLEERVAAAIPRRTAIFIDEIDCLRAVSWRNDFFASIRAAFNNRAKDPRLSNLVFCLLGVAIAADLIQDDKRTPFNIGRAISLSDFTQQEVAQILPGLSGLRADPRRLLTEIYDWTAGHPYMTQRLCEALVESEMPPNTSEKDWIEAIVKETFLTHGAPEQSLLSVRRIFESRVASTQTAQMLRLYMQVLSGQVKTEVNAEDQVQQALNMTGITRVVREGSGGMLCVRNRIFATVFDLPWAKQVESRRLIRAPLARWIEGGRSDEHLLRGEPLREALKWAESAALLSAEERAYIDTSARADAGRRSSLQNFLLITEAFKAYGNYLVLSTSIPLMLKGAFQLDDGHASALASKYRDALYLLPVLGGIIGDKILGHRVAVSVSLVFLSLGYILCTGETRDINMGIASLAAIAIGNLLYKSNLAALISKVYPANDVRVDFAFIAYYLGLNLGGLLAGLTTELIGDRYPMLSARIAAIAGILALGCFGLSQRFEENAAASKLELFPQRASLPEPPKPKQQRTGLIVFVLFVIGVIFWIAFGHIQEQNVQFLVRIRGSNDLLGHISDRAYKNLTYLLCVVFTPVVWLFSFKLRLRLSTISKMIIGVAATAIALMMLIVEQYYIPHWRYWGLSCCIVLSFAELFLVPLGSALISRLAPPDKTALTLATWYAAMSVGYFLSDFMGLGRPRSPELHLAGMAAAIIIILLAIRILYLLKGAIGRTAEAQMESVPGQA